eukprot:2953183-Pleurochrysis_carterae.AAC.3
MGALGPLRLTSSQEELLPYLTLLLRVVWLFIIIAVVSGTITWVLAIIMPPKVSCFTAIRYPKQDV